MYLKSLDLFGFKSFANKTHLEFSRGITCLIGPNGTGKSNILDAIQWVIGEQATTGLRVKKMDEVIFSGTKLRKPLDYAEVSLLFSNEDRALQIDTSEVEIRRKLFKNGQSEYYINRNLCRLKDINALFFNTGVGKTLYSIIQQGKISDVLLKKPEERRIIFEEASGISGFKQEEKESRSKLASMDENLKTVQIEYDNTKKSHDKLKLQAQRVEEYNHLNEKLKNYETKLSVLGYVQLEKDKTKCENEIKKDEEKLEKIRQNCEKVENEKAKIQKEISASQEQRHNIEVEIEKSKESINGVNYVVFGLENQHKRLTAQQEDYKKRYDSILEENKSNEKEIKKYEAEIVELRKKYKEIDEEIKKINASVADFKHKLEETVILRNKNDKDKQEYDEKLTSLCKEFALKTRDVINKIHAISELNGKDSKGLEEEIKSQIALLYKSSTKQAIDKLKELFDKYLERNKEFTLLAQSNKNIIESAQEDNKKIEETLLASSKIQEIITKCSQDYEKLSKEIAELEKLLPQKQEEKSSLLEKGSEISTKLDMLKEYKNTFESRLETAKKDYDDARLQLDNCLAQIKERKEFLEKTQKTIDKNTILISKIDKDVAKYEESLKNLIVQTSDETILAIKENIIRAKAKLETIDTSIKDLADSFYENHGLSLKAEVEKSNTTPTGKRDEIKAKISEIKKDIHALGEMNHLAKIEYEEVKVKYDLIKTQLDDLNKAREDLKIVNQEIKDRSSKLFMESFEKINEEFHNFFIKLFSGGDAYLSLDSDDPLTCGIDIIAKPAGKEPKDIIALSGGELTMTVFALLFSIYKIKASPFCILDEVESALDERNTKKFLSAVKEFKNTTQFIIITHNGHTVLGANTLLGTTQQELGVTDVLAITVDRMGDKTVYRDAKTGKETSIKLE